MKLSETPAIELENETLQADGTRLGEALAEIERLRSICQDIIEIIGAEYAQGADGPECIRKIDEIAHRYFIP